MRLAFQIGFLRPQNKQIIFFSFSLKAGLQSRNPDTELGSLSCQVWRAGTWKSVWGSWGWGMGTLIQFRSWETYSSPLLTAQKNHTVTWHLVIYILLPLNILVILSLSSLLIYILKAEEKVGRSHDGGHIGVEHFLQVTVVCLLCMNSSGWAPRHLVHCCRCRPWRRYDAYTCTWQTRRFSEEELITESRYFIVLEWGRMRLMTKKPNCVTVPYKL